VLITIGYARNFSLRAKPLKHLVSVVNSRSAINLYRWHKENFILEVRCARISHACAPQRFVEKTLTIC
jgi:hypothetical protein